MVAPVGKGRFGRIARCVEDAGEDRARHERCAALRGWQSRTRYSGSDVHKQSLSCPKKGCRVGTAHPATFFREYSLFLELDHRGHTPAQARIDLVQQNTRCVGDVAALLFEVIANFLHHTVQYQVGDSVWCDCGVLSRGYIDNIDLGQVIGLNIPLRKIGDLGDNLSGGDCAGRRSGPSG